LKLRHGFEVEGGGLHRYVVTKRVRGRGAAAGVSGAKKVQSERGLRGAKFERPAEPVKVTIDGIGGGWS